MSLHAKLFFRILGVIALLAIAVSACAPHAVATSSRGIVHSVIDPSARFDGAQATRRLAGTGHPARDQRLGRAQTVQGDTHTASTTHRGGPNKPSDHRNGVEVVGSWQQVGAVLIPVGVEGDVATFRFRGLSTVQGGWIGVFEQIGVLKVDLITGDSWGTSTQIFTGRSADGGIGSITIDEDFTIGGPPTLSLHGVARIVGGTGDFARSSGSFEDYGVTSLVGSGGYTAYWIRP